MVMYVPITPAPTEAIVVSIATVPIRLPLLGQHLGNKALAMDTTPVTIVPTEPASDRWSFVKKRPACLFSIIHMPEPNTNTKPSIAFPLNNKD